MFYKQNYEAVLAKNSNLAKQLSEMFLILAEENIEVYQAESGDYVFSYEGLVLDDMSNPKGDAALNFKENVPDDYSTDDIVVVYGLGTGYLFEYAALNTKANIILFEPKIEILRYCSEFVDISEKLLSNNVSIASSADEALGMVKRLIIPNKSRLTVVYPGAYIQLMQEDLPKFLSDVTALIAGD